MNVRFAMIKRAVFVMVATAMICQVTIAEEEDGHDEHEEEGEGLVLTESERNDAGIEIGAVELRPLSELLRLPGEVMPNAYLSAKVAPRIAAQVVKRHAHLGEQVQAGQRMVTLSSVEMADAQGALLVADQEWRRVQVLGKEVVSARRYTEAQVTRQAAMAKVLAFGMIEEQARNLLATGDASRATGAFDLLAPTAGTVLLDDFIVGELIEPGRVIFEISDETNLWVEASAVPSDIEGISIGTLAQVSVDGNEWINGEVVQLHHRLDESTRTQALRIAVSNEDDELHAGEFVQVAIKTAETKPLIAVPREAVVLLRGDTVVFALHEDNEFEAVLVDTDRTVGDWIVIRSGLHEGDRIVVQGSFFLKSLLLKSEIGEGHEH
ncbi:MAG: efflux RND transporter periplasmic adaptor subunit [Chloroflexi bacterium]|nr:MAG: efflux RND transporter periplasmic adaptor subunit [Chloroflexota bacterium]